MFKKSNRLTKSEFEECFKKGSKKHFPHLTIVTGKADKTKISVVVGKKVAKSAVKRNLLRRRVYALLKDFHSEVSELKNMIVILKPSYNSLSRKEAKKILLESVAQVVKGK